MKEDQVCPGETAGTAKARRSVRITAEVPILIMGSDAEGTVFSEETHTVVLSLHGAGIVSRNKLIPEQELILRDVSRNREAEARVVGEIAQQGRLYTYGVAFVDERLNFWQVEFPPAQAWEERTRVLALECSGCRGVMDLENGEFEYDICAIQGGLARFCDKCGLLTVWRVSTDPMRVGRRVEGSARKQAEEAPPALGAPVAVAGMESPKQLIEEIVSVADAMEGMERRGRVRAKVSFFACVRSEEFGEDIVKCVDMSRGGVGFHSEKCYKAETHVRIAVPYTPGAKDAPAIFIKGRIANVREIPGEGMWRCGVEFLQ